MELNGWTSPQVLRRYGASARSARARHGYDRVVRDVLSNLAAPPGWPDNAPGQPAGPGPLDLSERNDWPYDNDVRSAVLPGRNRDCGHEMKRSELAQNWMRCVASAV